MTGGYPVETVGGCVTETQIRFHRCPPEHWIDRAKPRDRRAGAHVAGDVERAVPEIRAGDIVFDQREASLWAHALGRDDDRMISCPRHRDT